MTEKQIAISAVALAFSAGIVSDRRIAVLLGVGAIFMCVLMFLAVS